MIALVFGAVFGAGLLIARSAFGLAQPLSQLWGRRVDSERVPDWMSEDEAPLGILGAGLTRVMSVGAVDELFEGSSFAKDLAVCGKDRVDFVAHAVAKAAIVVALGLVVAAASGPASPASGSRPFGLSVAIAIIVVLLDVQAIQNQAVRRRAEIFEAVTAFVEFTRLASHTQSVEGAMRAAVRMGATWPFRRLERIFEQAERHREPPWRGLTGLGHRYGMPEMVELGGALENAGTEGTRIQAMLAAKATSMRRHMTEREIERASAATQKLAVPLGLLAVIFVGVLLAPAVLAF